MSKKLFIGNLSFKLQENELAALFEPYGSIESCRLMMDRETGRSKGFAFIEMADDDAARKAIDELNGKEIDGRALRVDEAKDRPPRREGGGGGGGRGGFGGGGGGRGGFGGGGGGGGGRGPRY